MNHPIKRGDYDTAAQFAAAVRAYHKQRQTTFEHREERDIIARIASMYAYAQPTNKKGTNEELAHKLWAGRPAAA